MSEEQNIERFDAFLKGEMNSSQKKAFLQELKINEELKKSFEEHKLLFEAFKRKGRAAMMAELSTVHEGMGKVNVEGYNSHNSNAWRNFFRNLFLFGAIGAIGLFGFKYWDDIKKLDEDTMPFGEPKKGQEVRIFIDTIKTSEVAFDTVYKEIRVSGTADEMKQQIEEEMRKIREENEGVQIEIREKTETTDEEDVDKEFQN